MIRLAAALAALLFAVTPATAFELRLGGAARQLSERDSPLGSYALPTGPFRDGSIPAQRLEGRIERQTWRIDGPGLTTLQILAPLRSQLEEAGYTLTFDCKDNECGGFDFRFGTEVVPAPDMYVDIRNYRFVSAVKDKDIAASLLVSRSRSAGFVQIIYVNRDGTSAPPAALPETGTEAAPVPDIAAGFSDRMLQQGHAVLGGLVFDTGADALDPGDYDSLAQLAVFLEDHPGMVIALVGHTDSIGSLDENLSLSKRRAESVRSRMIDSYGIAPDRMEAEGVAYLSPAASNLTPEGREENRRVEAVILREQ